MDINEYIFIEAKDFVISDSQADNLASLLYEDIKKRNNNGKNIKRKTIYKKKKLKKKKTA